MARDGLKRVFVYRAKAYEEVAQGVLRTLGEAGLDASLQPLDHLKAIESTYDDDFLVVFNEHFDEFSDVLKSKQPFIAKHWRNAFKLTGMGGHFSEVFAHPPDVIESFTGRVSGALDRRPDIRYSTLGGTDLAIDLSSSKAMTIIDGIQGDDMVPGEAATFTEKISGPVAFEGTFLCLIPFAAKYGVVGPKSLAFDIEAGRVKDLRGDNTELVSDLNKHFARHPDNNSVDEVGFGTNLGVTRLYGTNSVFEERHLGLHLGLGGKTPGSLHLDLLFEGGDIDAGGRRIFQGGAYLPAALP
ncbi:MAG: hypothetical protein HYZ75_03865 [Elusimicrobia bacterium]|nr:hypothetical protein [Elusimicrobiota bacterium]